MYLKKPGGFTLVELTIAMAIFSILLLVMTTGVIKLFNIYQAGHQIRDTQQTARVTAEEISRDTHKAGYVLAGTRNGRDAVCIYKTDAKIGDTWTGTLYYLDDHPDDATAMAVHRALATFTVTTDVPTGCTVASIANDETISASTVTMQTFRVVKDGSAADPPRMVRLTMSVVSKYADQTGGSDPDIEDPDGDGFFTCIAGSTKQYCSITNLQTSVLSLKGAN